MFKIEPLTDVSWPVTIRKPLSGGKHESIKVEITYPLVESDEYDELMKLNVVEVVPRVVKGWREHDFGDADGTPLAFSPENLARLLKREYIVIALFDGFCRAQRGALEKN